MRSLRLLWLLFAFALWPFAAQATNCAPVPPVQRDIDTGNFYTDKHHSVRDESVWDENQSEMSDLNTFLALITSDADAFAGTGDKEARVCALQALDAWGQSGALLGDMSNHGTLDRMWAVGAIALSVIKLGTPLKGPARNWFETVSNAVRQDVEQRTAKSGVSNLTYWGAMAVGASGIVLGRADDWQFAQSGLRAGLDNIGADGTLTREMGRGQRATHYQDYAAEPLVVLARLSARQGAPLDADDHAKLDRLVTLVIAAANNPQLLAQAAGTAQRPIKMPTYLVLWNKPQSGADAHDPIYVQLGGDTRILNSVLAKRSR